MSNGNDPINENVKKKTEMEEKQSCNLPLRKRIHSFTNVTNSTTEAPPTKSPVSSPPIVKDEQNEVKNLSYTSPKPTKIKPASLEYSPPIDIETVSDDDEKTTNIMDKMIHDLSPPSSFPSSLISKPKPPLNITLKQAKPEENFTIINRRGNANGITNKSVESNPVNKKRNFSNTEKNSGQPKKRKSKKQDEDSDSSSEDEEEETYCFCRKPDHGKFMIACDQCDEWFHGECVNITKEQASKIKNYLCQNCKKEEEDKAIKQAKKLRKCFHIACANVAKPNSKYCSDNCGIASNREALKRHKFHELNSKANALSATDLDDFKKLEEMQSKRKGMELRIQSIYDQTRELERAIQHASTLLSNGEEDKKEKTEEHNIGSSEIVDCVTCGRPIPSKNYSRHIESCYQKVSGVKTHVKNGRQLLCGCPTSENGNALICDRLKKNCDKHINWENLKRVHLEQEKMRQEQSFNALLEEERIIQDRIVRRSHALTNNSVHRTIIET